MKSLRLGIGAFALLVTSPAFAHGDKWDDKVMIVTASNTSANALLVYSTKGELLTSIPTRGMGGVTGNAGGIAQNHQRLAVVNHMSQNVSVFVKDSENTNFRFERMIPAIDTPVSVALSEHHLYILTATHIESHPMGSGGFTASADGSAQLTMHDGSAAQVGILPGELIITEKANAIETIGLNGHGAVSGMAKSVRNIPPNIDTPFGLVTRGNNAYVTIAHANEISLVRNDTITTITGSGDQKAPCWAAIDGSFLYTSNSPSHSISRYAVYGQKIVADDLTAAKVSGAPTDIDASNGLASVIDGDGQVTHLSVFKIGNDGELTMQGMATINNPAVNGVAIVWPE